MEEFFGFSFLTAKARANNGPMPFVAISWLFGFLYRFLSFSFSKFNFLDLCFVCVFFFRTNFFRIWKLSLLEKFVKLRGWRRKMYIENEFFYRFLRFAIRRAGRFFNNLLHTPNAMWKNWCELLRVCFEDYKTEIRRFSRMIRNTNLKRTNLHVPTISLSFDLSFSMLRGPETIVANLNQFQTINSSEMRILWKNPINLRKFVRWLLNYLFSTWHFDRRAGYMQVNAKKKSIPETRIFGGSTKSALPK